MTDRTHPDSGRIITSSDVIADLHARIAELEAQLEAIRAGGVNSPLVGQPQAMPDLSQLTERGAKTWAASAMAGEPMAWMTFTEEGDPDMVFLDRLEACQYCEDDDPPKPLYLASPPPAQAEGWTKASKQLPTCREDQPRGWSMGSCTFDLAWRGPCKATCEGSVCTQHATVKCCVCGEQATHECDNTGQFVCGAPLCNNCEGHTDTSKPAGGWGFMNHTHRQKDPS